MKKNDSGLLAQIAKLTLYGALAFLTLLGLLTIAFLFFPSRSDKPTYVQPDSPRRDFLQLDFMDQIHGKQLRKIQHWFISTGVGDFYKSRDKTPIQDYVKKRGYYFRVEPSIDRHYTYKGKQQHTLARIVIQAKYLYNQLWCLAQVDHGGKIYEYWVMHENSRRGKYKYRNCEFMVSETDSLQGTRKIIHTSPQFFKDYKLPDDFTLAFPKERVLQLRVNYYPECYQETDMEEVKNVLKRLK